MALFLSCWVCFSCSTTKGVPEGDQLFIGLTKIDYQDYERNSNFIDTQVEVEAALATAPNGALFGSSYYRTPFPYGLWIWNAFNDKESGFAKWMTKSFGKQPVLMSWVNPALRASVAQSVLRKYGYFRGSVSYDTIPRRNPKKAKIGYTVKMGHLFTVDSIDYVNFPEGADSVQEMLLPFLPLMRSVPVLLTSSATTGISISRMATPRIWLTHSLFLVRCSCVCRLLMISLKRQRISGI